MFSNEGFFRLLSVGILGIVFLSVTATAEKEKKPTSKSLFSVIQHVEEAEKVNNGEYQVLNLTSIGERVELITPSQIKK